MSTVSVRAHLDPRSRSVNRLGATAGALILTAAYLSILYHVVDVAGGSGGVAVFALEIAVSFALAAGLSRTLSIRQAVALGTVLLVVGLVGYVIMVPGAYFDLGRQTNDTIALLTGLSVLRLTKAGIWALGFTPAPVFVSWYCFLRRRYVMGVIVGGAALGFFLLTGNADTVLGLVGVLGALAVIGFGQLDHEQGTGPQRQTVISVLIAILVVTTTVSLVPGGEARPLLPNRGSATVEGSLVNAGQDVQVLGSIRLSPEVRFTVTATEGARWRAGAYDRYTGDGWVRTGRTSPYPGRLSSPETDDVDRIRQTFVAESSVNVMPAAWKPVRVSGRADQTLVTAIGGLQPEAPLAKGDRYSVESFQPRTTADGLRAAGTDYPDPIRDRFLQLPESTPQRVTTFTSRLTANAENPYDSAAVIERWLRRNKGYSLDVNRPRGDIAAGFLFDMQEGYCVYFATTMVTMLRSQDIPARFVVGYTAGQRVAEDRWVVRGLDSHAWVEAYFPGHGWVAFDPTPSGPRQAIEQDRVDQARDNDVANVDTDLSSQGTYATPTPVGATTPTPAAPGAESDSVRGANTTGTPPIQLFGAAGGTTNGSTGESGDSGGLPSRETMLYGAILLAGVGMAVHRSGAVNRGYRAVWLRRRPTGTPSERIQGTFARLEYLLGRRYRQRRLDETRREYLQALRARGIDDRAGQLYRLYERARYAGTADTADAETAWELLVDLRETGSRLR